MQQIVALCIFLGGGGRGWVIFSAYMNPVVNHRSQASTPAFVACNEMLASLVCGNGEF